MASQVSLVVWRLCLVLCCVDHGGQLTRACPDSFWGAYCENRCSDRCKDIKCHQDTGVCLACQIHFAEPDCTECADGYYSSTSDNSCFYCGRQCYNNSPCNKTTGRCDRCPAGHSGDSCNERCPNGMYGQDCVQKCGFCQEETCDTVTGQCQHCQPGYQLPFCTQKCENNTHGTDCSEQCGSCADGQPCIVETGHCAKCAPGKMVTDPVNYCQEDCENGYYGQDCAESCGLCHDGLACDKVTGKCLQCVEGRPLPYCKEPPGDEASGELRLLIGVLVGAALIIIFLAVAVICWRKTFKARRSDRGGNAT